jgi:hypothetical protein
MKNVRLFLFLALPFAQFFAQPSLAMSGIGFANTVGYTVCMAEPMLQLNGMRVAIPGSPAVYLIDQGRRRWIPSEAAYNRIFPDYEGLEWNYLYLFVEEGPALNDAVSLVVSDENPAVYLLDGSVKRWISSEGVFDYYHFDRNKIM